MSSIVSYATNWNVYEEEYEISYSLTHSRNNDFEEFEIWEYGIQCALYDKDQTIISTAEIKHISPDHNFVMECIQTLTKHKVFPNHLIDVISNILAEKYSC